MKRAVIIFPITIALFSLVALMMSGSRAKKVWKLKIPRGPSGSVTVGPGNLVYAGGLDGFLYALDGETGQVRWKTSLGNGAWRPPVVYASTVFIGTWAGKLLAVEAVTGAIKWEFQAPDSYIIRYPFADQNGTVYVGTSGEVDALDGTTGAVTWRFQPKGGAIYMTLDNYGTIYIGSNNSVYALDIHTHKERWEFPHRGWFIGVGDDPERTVCISSLDYKLYAVDGLTGKERWMFPRSQSGLSFHSAIAPDGTVFAATREDVLALDGRTGALRWREPIGNDAPPVVRPDGTILVGSNYDSVYSLDAATGKRLWKCRLNWNFNFGINGATVFSPTIGPNGLIYVASMDEKIYALRER